MTVLEFAVILLMTGYAVYKQTRRHELHASRRFTVAIVYAMVAACVGGFALPHTFGQAGFLGAGIGMSLIVGLLRGHYSRLWLERGHAVAQGTALTVTLFLLLIAGKFALGTVAYFGHVTTTGGFGEILLLVAIMIAIQAQIVHIRARRLEEAAATRLSCDTAPLEAIDLPAASATDLPVGQRTV